MVWRPLASWGNAPHPAGTTGPRAGGRMGLGPTLGWITLAALVGCATAADGSGPTAPRAGLWSGAELRFRVADGELRDLILQPQACVRDGAQANYAGAVTGATAAQLAVPFSLVAGDLRVEGRFTSAEAASGALRLGAEDAVCVLVGAWAASWEGPDPQAAGGGAPAGSVDWGGASLGDLHPGPARPAPGPRAPATMLGDQRDAALARLDAVRAAVGVGPISGDPAAHAAAQAHAAFYVAHAAAYQAAKLSPHAEDAAFGEGFTGENFGARMKAQGFGGAPAAEVMAFTGSGTQAVQGWLETLYHRLPLIDPRSVAVGVGVAAAAKAKAEVMVFGSGAAVGDPVVVYPYPGQSDVPRAWSGNESPQPPAPKAGYPSGPVITAHLPAGAKVVGHALRPLSGGATAHVYLDGSLDPDLAAFDSRAVALYAETPLEGDRGYEVELSLEIAGAPRRLIWRFHTAP